MGEDALPWRARAQDGHVGYAKMVSLGLDALLGKRKDPPFFQVLEEDANQNCLQPRVLKLAQVALLDDAVHILAVVLEDPSEIFLDGDGMVDSGLRCRSEEHTSDLQS